MAYTRVWDSTAPNGATVDAEDIDQVFQQLRVDIVERLNDIIGGTDFETADPVKFTKIRFAAAVATIVAGATSLALRNAADDADNFILTDAGLATLRNKLTIAAGGLAVTGLANNVPVAVGDVNSNTNLDFTSGNVQHLRLTGGTPVLTLTNAVAGSVLVVKVLQNGTGGYSYTFAAGSGTLKWSNGVTPTPTVTANKADIYSFYFDGTDYYGAQTGANY